MPPEFDQIQRNKNNLAGNPKLQKHVINDNMTQQAYLGMPQIAALVATSNSGHKVHSTENVYRVSSLTEHDINNKTIGISSQANPPKHAMLMSSCDVIPIFAS